MSNLARLFRRPRRNPDGRRGSTIRRLYRFWLKVLRHDKNPGLCRGTGAKGGDRPRAGGVEQAGRVPRLIPNKLNIKRGQIMEKTFSLPREIIALSGITSKNTSRVGLHAVHFDGKRDGRGWTLHGNNPARKSGTGRGEPESWRNEKAKNRFRHVHQNRGNPLPVRCGAADVAECSQPNYKAVLPAVSPDNLYHAIALNLELLSGLYKAIDSGGTREIRKIWPILISKANKLDAIGVVSSNSPGIGDFNAVPAFRRRGYPAR